MTREKQLGMFLFIGVFAFLLIGATNGNTWAYFTLGLCLSGVAGLARQSS